MQETDSQQSPQQQPQPQQQEEQPNQSLNQSLEESVKQLEQEHTQQELASAQQEEQEAKEPKRQVPQPKASHFAALHRQQVQLVKEKQAFAAEKAELQKQIKALENAKRSPADAIRAMGYESVEKFLEQIASSGGEMTPEQQKIWELEERLAARERQEEEQRKILQEQQESAKYQQEVANWHNSIREYVSDPDGPWANTLVSLGGQEPAVLQLLQQQHEQYGDELDIAQGLELALDTVNKQLEKQMRQGIAQIVAHPRGRAILEEITGSVKPASQKARPQSLGITNAARNETKPKPKYENLSVDDTLQQAIQQLRREDRAAY